MFSLEILIPTCWCHKPEKKREKKSEEKPEEKPEEKHEENIIKNASETMHSETTHSETTHSETTHSVIRPLVFLEFTFYPSSESTIRSGGLQVKLMASN